jgi:hypothetical protein
MIEIVVAEQTNTIQRFEGLENAYGIRPLVQEVAQEDQSLIGVWSKLVQKRGKLTTAPVNVSDNDRGHGTVILPMRKG